MGDFTDTYANAVKEFESLTTKRAATLKNKGREEGLKKLNMLFKSGKTLQQRAAAYDTAIEGFSRCKTPADEAKALKNLEAARQKLTDGLKENIKSFTVEAKGISPADGDMKAGFEVFLGRLGQMVNRAKMETEQRKSLALKAAGKQTVGGKIVSDIKTTYLNVRKGCDETEALMKKFIARPTRENFAAAFYSGTGPRSISVAVTNWKQLVLKADPGVANKLTVDPVHLIENPAMWDATQRKDANHWTAKLKMDQPGWEDRAKKAAQDILDQVKHWRRVADEMKAIIA
jgi:hypothetical protein